MKKVLKLLSIIICASMLLALAACGGNSNPSSTSNSTANTNAPEASNAPDSDATGEGGGKLIMGTNAFFPPYEFYDGTDEIVGIDPEIAAKIAEKLGMELVIEDMEFKSILVALEAGQIDIGMAGMTVTEDRLKSVNFAESYATGIQVIIVKEGSDITGPDDLPGKKIGVQLGTTGDTYASDDYGDENVERYPKGAEAIVALMNGQIDCVVIDNEPAKAFVSANDGLVILETEYYVEDYAIAIAKNDTELLDKINTALQELKEDGTIQSILDKYINAE